MKITPELLKREYDDWGLNNRCNSDLRFGQYIFNKYSYEWGQSYSYECKDMAYSVLASGLIYD